MPVTLADVDHIAALARLGLREAERESLRAELESILGYVDQLRGLDTEAVEPTTSIVRIHAALREDRVTSLESAETLLAGAPDRDGTFLRVPKILQGS
jgi:aspartyl-tRNA(Asn)/glutamyl-tRNA(Gln) amidotransferase subunit C